MPETTAEERAFADKAQAPDNAQVTRQAWEMKVRLARWKTAAVRGTACANADEMLEETVQALGAGILPMDGSEYDMTEKGVVFATTGKPIAFYSAAGVESVKALVDALGEGPWPYPVTIYLAPSKTKRGPKAVALIGEPDGEPGEDQPPF